MLKVSYPNRDHSKGRGVGYYGENLIDTLLKLKLVEVSEHKPDLIHYTFFDPFYHTLPNSFSIPTIVTVHDITPLVLSRLYPQGLRAKLNLTLQKLSLHRANAVITDSKNSKNDIVKYLSLPTRMVHPIHLAADKKLAKSVPIKTLKQVKEKYHLPEQFVFYIGGANPNKNLLRLARACQRLNLILVLGGGDFVKESTKTLSVKEKLGLQNIHPEQRDLEQLKKLITTDPMIIATGPIAPEDLSAVFRLATIYCQPSLYEGFGLPVLEAMTAGCLVVCSNTSSLPEIFPPSTITFNPEKQEDIETALTAAFSLTQAQRDQVLRAQTKKVAEFSWEKTARETYAVYLSVLTK